MLRVSSGSRQVRLSVFLVVLLAVAAAWAQEPRAGSPAGGAAAQGAGPQTPGQATATRGTAAVPAPPVDRQKKDETPKFSVETRLVVLHATVLDRDKHLVTDLRRENFKVYEDEVEQQIRDFKREDIPISIGILIDNSGSMREKRAKVNAAAMTFVRTSNPSDEVFIVNFNDEAFLDKDFTSNLDELKEGLEKIDSRGGTAFYDAIQMSIDHLKEGGRKSKKALLVVTDGEDNASRMDLEQLVKYVHESEAVIYTVGVLGDENPRSAKRARKALEAISEASGGAAFFPREVNDVEGIATRIAHDIRNQYVLTYTPGNAADDARFHSVAVKATSAGHGKLFVRTRTGYYGRGASPSPARSTGE